MKTRPLAFLYSFWKTNKPYKQTNWAENVTSFGGGKKWLALCVGVWIGLIIKWMKWIWWTQNAGGLWPQFLSCFPFSSCYLHLLFITPLCCNTSRDEKCFRATQTLLLPHSVAATQCRCLGDVYLTTVALGFRSTGDGWGLEVSAYPGKNTSLIKVCVCVWWMMSAGNIVRLH